MSERLITYFDSQTFMTYLEKKSDRCGYTNYLTNNLHYPPKGHLPLPGGTTNFAKRDCDIWNDIFEAALIINPAFNIYRYVYLLSLTAFLISLRAVSLIHIQFYGTCLASRKFAACLQCGSSYLYHHRSGSFPQEQTSPLYFDRADVKRAIHAPVNVTWTECSNGNVYNTKDGLSASQFSALSVLPNVIQKSKRTVIMHGLADYVLIAEGTRIVIQKSVSLLDMHYKVVTYPIA